VNKQHCTISYNINALEFLKEYNMKTDTEKKADHIRYLIKAAKEAGIQVIIKVPTKLN
jgi:ribosomal protein L11